MARIAVQMIVRNEGKHLMQCLNSLAQYVTHIFIGLAGESTDNTLEVIEEARENGLRITAFPIEWNDNFAEARNQVMDAIRADGSYTHSLWIDGDDVLVGGEFIEPALRKFPDAAALMMKYEYWRDEFGNTSVVLIRNRVLNLANNWKWQNAIHEVVLHSDPGAGIMMEGTFIRHMGQEKERDTGRNLRLLEKDVLERGNRNPVMIAYLAAEYAVRDQHETAIPLWDEAVRTAKLDDEKYIWMHKMSDSLRALGQYDEADQVDFTCIQFKPDWPDAYYGLAENAFGRKDWKAVVTWTTMGQRFAQPNTTLPINPLDYTVSPLIMLAIAQGNLGDHREALELAKKAYKTQPTELLHQIIEQFQDATNQEKVFNAFMIVHESLRRNDEWLKAREIFKYAPKMLEAQPDVNRAYQEVMESTRHVDDPSVLHDYYINNPGWEPMPEEVLDSAEWKKHPRVAYAIEVARRIDADSIVDTGASDGFMAIPLAQDTAATRIDGLDLDPRCVDLANSRAAARGLEERVKLYQGPFEMLDEWSSCEGFTKYDLAIFFETIEHVVDPAATLDVLDRAASHVALTTPFMAWEGDNQPDWNKVELKGHLRIFDLADIEMLLQHRGRIHNLYREYWDSRHSWIFADYAVGETVDKNIQIICPPALEPWGPRKLNKQGLGGSETAVVRLAEGFSEMGHLVTVYNNMDEAGFFNKVRYRELDQYFPTVKTDLSIAWRTPELADHRPNTDCFVLWMHDTDAGDRLTAERAAKFDRIVVLSNWHRQYFLSRYHFVRPDQLVVIGNGVDPSRFDWLDTERERDEKKVVYSSSPDRGLDIILEHVWPRVLEEVPDATLHYYYGWNNFQAMSHVPQLRQFRQKVMNLQERTKNVFDHGRLPQGELAEELMGANVWLYPTYFPETYCITAVEAQLAGLLPVTNSFAALKETVKTGIVIPGDVRESSVHEAYARAVIDAIKNPLTRQDREAIAKAAPAQTWLQIAQRWGAIFLN